MKVVIEKEIESWWGVDDLRPLYPYPEDFKKAIILLLMADVAAVLDGATWTIVDRGGDNPVAEKKGRE